MTLREGAENLLYLHADLCLGCTHCLRVCPTEAIRIRRGKAEVLRHRCIECGQCISACPREAWKVLTDAPERIPKGEADVLLDPAVFWQFGESWNSLGSALREIGFAEVHELGSALDCYAAAVKDYLRREDRPRPVISAFCPAVRQLIQVKFPSLLENLMPVRSPYEIGFSDLCPAMGLASRGIYAVIPCLAQASLLCRLDSPALRGVVSLADIYNPVKMRVRKSSARGEDAEKTASVPGAKWAAAGGESEAADIRRSLIVEGIHQVSRLFNLAESGLLEDIAYIEAWACETGCLGGPLTVENAFVARYRLRQWARFQEKKFETPARTLAWESISRPPFPPRTGMRLDENLKTAMVKLARIDEVVKTLPGLDCGSCGSPTCLALAEDIVQRRARPADCFHARRRATRPNGRRPAASRRLRRARTIPESGEKHES